MTVESGDCDFCGRGDGLLLSTGDDHSVVFAHGECGTVVWDGYCREGSTEYFKSISNDRLFNVLRQALKIDDSQDIFYEFQELAYRMEDD